MAPNDSHSLVQEITPHGTVTYHEEMPEKAHHLPHRSVILVSSSTTSYMEFDSNENNSKMGLCK